MKNSWWWITQSTIFQLTWDRNLKWDRRNWVGLKLMRMNILYANLKLVWWRSYFKCDGYRLDILSTSTNERLSEWVMVINWDYVIQWSNLRWDLYDMMIQLDICWRNSSRLDTSWWKILSTAMSKRAKRMIIELITCWWNPFDEDDTMIRCKLLYERTSQWRYFLMSDFFQFDDNFLLGYNTLLIPPPSLHSVGTNYNRMKKLFLFS